MLALALFGSAGGGPILQMGILGAREINPRAQGTPLVILSTSIRSRYFSLRAYIIMHWCMAHMPQPVVCYHWKLWKVRHHCYNATRETVSWQQIQRMSGINYWSRRGRVPFNSLQGPTDPSFPHILSSPNADWSAALMELRRTPRMVLRPPRTSSLCGFQSLRWYEDVVVVELQ